uniref:Uncharacterized protein n=1 Tax=Arundo donax TaxID=35708 RepID=A0A0A8Y5R9_ARUDO
MGLLASLCLGRLRDRMVYRAPFTHSLFNFPSGGFIKF